MSAISARARPLRLYRGLTRAYDPERVAGGRSSSTNFTDCPYTATAYAPGRNGVVLVLDVPRDAACVSEELWLVAGSAKRFVIWGRFDAFVIATIPAKELRAEVRRAGVVTLPDDDKGMLLRARVDARLREAGRRRATHERLRSC